MRGAEVLVPNHATYSSTSNGSCRAVARPFEGGRRRHGSRVVRLLGVRVQREVVVLGGRTSSRTPCSSVETVDPPFVRR